MEAFTEILDCGHPPTPAGTHSLGYGSDDAGRRYCYPCCAERDRQQMRADGRACLYLSKDENGWKVSNWPGSLALRPHYVKRGSHNIARERYDVWFVFEGFVWHGVNIGDNQILRCRRTKEAAA